MADKSMTSTERGTKDDWETIKVVIDELPALRQRVLHKLRELKNTANKRAEAREAGISISKKDAVGFRLEAKNKKKEEKK